MRKHEAKENAPPKLKKRFHDPRFSEELVAKIIGGTMAGNWPDIVAQSQGISKRLFSSWMARGEVESVKADDGEALDPDEAKYLDFYTKVKAAMAWVEIAAISAIMNPKESDNLEIKWAIWWLERARRDRWSPHQDVSIHGPNNGPIQMEVDIENDITRILSAEDRERIAEIFIRAENRQMAEGIDNENAVPVPYGSLEEDRSGSISGQLAHPTDSGVPSVGDDGKMPAPDN